jgi:hypothetical protein
VLLLVAGEDEDDEDDEKDEEDDEDDEVPAVDCANMFGTANNTSASNSRDGIIIFNRRR